MKKPIAIMWSLWSIWGYSAELKLQNNMSEIHKSIIATRGSQQMREQKIFEKIEKFGLSGSNQYLEGIIRLKSVYDDDDVKSNYDYKNKTAGFLMGTSSNFIKYPNLRVGVNYGYLKSTIRFDDSPQSKTKVRTHGLEIFLGYNYDEWQIIGRFGYTQSKNKLNVSKNYNRVHRDNSYNIGGEIGRYITLGDKFAFLYPYVGIGYDYYRIKPYENISNYTDGIASGDLGITFYKEFNEKILLSTDVSWNHEFDDRKNLERDNVNFHRIETGNSSGQFNVSVGYFYDPDFLITVRYQGFFNQNYYYNLVGVGLSHNF